IAGMYTLLNTSINGAGACHTFYNASANLLYLVDDAGGLSLPSAVPGTAGTRSNSQCTLNTGASSVSASGNNLTLTLVFSFSGSWSGTKNDYLIAFDRGSQSSGWTQVGTWTVGTVSQPPVAVSVTPPSGTASSQTFSYTVSSVNGAGYISSVY